MRVEILNVSGANAAHEEEVRRLLVELLKPLAGQPLAVGLDALLSAYVSTVSHARSGEVNFHSAATLRKCADFLAAGAFDQAGVSPPDSKHVH